MTQEEIPHDFIKAIETRSSFYVIPHIEPDGDCVGSALALAHFLERMGKQAFLHCMGPFVRKEIQDFSPRFYGHIDRHSFNHEAEAVLIVDCSTLDRIGALAEDIDGLPILLIDHHSSGTDFGDYRFINSSSPSTSLLVLQLIETMGYTPTLEEAELLLFGFCTDTGYFRHMDQNSGEALRYASRLLDCGANPKKIWQRMNSGARLDGRKHLGNLVARTESYAQGKVLITWEYLHETRAIGRENRESDLLYQLLMGIEGVEVVICLREESSGCTNGGLRSRTSFDVGELAMRFGGGGHARASGFQVQRNLEQTKRDLISDILSRIS